MDALDRDDDESKKMESVFSDARVLQRLKEADIVSIQIKSNSTECQQFGQIYPVVVIPSTYFIAVDGMPLEIIGGAIDVEEFNTKLSKIFESHKRLLAGETHDKTAPAGDEKEKSTSQPVDASCEKASEGGDTRTEIKATPSTSQVTTESLEPDVSTSEAPPGEMLVETDDELAKKKERAQELIQIQRMKKRREEEEKEKQKEIERLKLGKNLQEFKTKQKEEEAKQLAADLAKDKEDDKKARERVKAQIAKDREERAAKYHKEKEELEQQKQELQQRLCKERELAENMASQRSQSARIQFRFSDGSALIETFPADETLQTVRSYICDKNVVNTRSFTLSTTFPRRIFTDGDLSMSLRDLQLAPSAVIIVLPGQSALQSSDSALNTIFWSVMKPFVYIYGLICNFLFGQPDQRSPPANVDSRHRKRNQEEAESQPRSSQAYKRRVVDDKSSVRVGNIHRFKNNEDDDDDDENNTWNGNSTQQM